MTILALLSQSDVFIDVGANQGFYSLRAASLGKNVAAVEPEQGNLRFLMANLSRNSLPVEVFAVALANDVGITDLFGDGDMASLVSGWRGNSSRFFKQPVPVNRLDNLFASRWSGEKLLIKVDVEGAEGAVLAGASRMLNRTPAPQWVIETFPEDGSFRDVFRTMFEASYTATTIDANPVIVTTEMVEEWIANPHVSGRGGSNFLFTKNGSPT